jgi:hypothetical protein
MLRWLTRTSVYQFLDIVGRTADRYMWQYRRAFWTSYLEAGHIDEAWVVFGANGAPIAERAMRLDNSEKTIAFGKAGQRCQQKSGSLRANHENWRPDYRRMEP